MATRPKITLSAEFNPGRAKVCPEHGGRLECTKRRYADREPCHGLAIRGTDACKKHGGIRPSLAKAQGEARVSAWSPHGSQTGRVDAGMAVLGVLQMSWLRLATYSAMLKDQIDVAKAKNEGDPTDGIIGHRYGMGGKEGILYTQTEEIRALITLEAMERERVVKFAKVAHDMGISERLTNLAERWADIVASRIATVLAELSLTPQQSVKVPALLQAHLGSIDMEEIGGSTK